VVRFTGEKGKRNRMKRISLVLKLEEKERIESQVDCDDF